MNWDKLFGIIVTKFEFKYSKFEQNNHVKMLG